DDAVAAAVGPEDGKTPAAVLDDFGVDAGTGASQRADEFADETLTLDPSQPGDDGQPGMETEAERVRASLDDQPLVAHGHCFDLVRAVLEPWIPLLGSFQRLRLGFRDPISRGEECPLSSVGRAQPW